MTTKIRFEQNAIMAAAHLTDTEDDGYAFVFCSIPGGTPQFQTDPKSQHATTVVNAPQCDTVKQFKAFVIERFGGET